MKADEERHPDLDVGAHQIAPLDAQTAVGENAPGDGKLQSTDIIGYLRGHHADVGGEGHGPRIGPVIDEEAGHATCPVAGDLRRRAIRVP